MKRKLSRKKIILPLIPIFIIPLASLYAVAQMGEYRLNQREAVKNTLVWNGKEYCYNDNIISFLLMGTDKIEGANLQEDGSLNHIKGGQADALFLLSINTSNGDISVISIPRNSMAEIIWCDKDGKKLTTIFDCICLQHAYGNGEEQSCERTVNAVSQMLNNIPISGYAAINMTSVIAFNDLVGGVDVELLEQISLEEIERLDIIENEETLMALRQDNNTDVLRMPVGTKVHLEGRNAYYYVRWRAVDAVNSTPERNKRQKQYAEAFLNKALHLTKKDPFFPLKAYREVRSEMVTNITLPEIIYLSPVLTKLDSNKIKFYSLSGEYTFGEYYWKYYLDESKMKDLLTDLFYTETK